jgi:AraC-like DNA-binding protein
MSEPHLAAPLFRNFVEDLVGYGLDRDALLARARTPPEALSPTRLRVPYALLEDLAEAGEALSGDDRLGFHLGRARPLDVMGLPGILIAASGTLRAAHHRIARFARLWSSGYRFEVHDVPDGMYTSFDLGRPDRRAHVHLREMFLADGIRFARQVTGRDLDVDVWFPHARAGDLAEYERYFGGEVRFGAGVLAAKLSTADVDQPLPTASSLVLGLFERRAEQELAELVGRRGVVERVRGLLEDDLEHLRLGDASLDDVARRMKTSARSLQRALGREGARFAEVLESVRRAAAERMLRGDLEIAEVSWRLGYAEPPVFFRAFKRWTGQTPDAWRSGS